MATILEIIRANFHRRQAELGDTKEAAWEYWEFHDQLNKHGYAP